MGSIKIAPSVLSADMANLKGELDKIAGADYVHFDVMDGHALHRCTGRRAPDGVEPRRDR